MAEDQGGLTPEQQAAIRALALETLIAFRDGGSIAAPMPTGPDLKQILEFMAGGLEIDDYLPMMREELALTADLRAPRWHKDDVNPDKPFKVVIIGAGMSGIVAAYRLAEADVPYIVIDKNADVGGTWLENSYPGCRVDIPNHYYSYSFAQRDDWPLYYSPRAELYKYFRECVDEFGIRPNIRFNTEVSSVEYDDESATWTVCTVDTDGREAQHPGQRRDQRRRPAEPPAAAEDRGPRVVRRAGVPLGPLGPRRRPHRQAGRCDRHRLQRRPVRTDRRRAGRPPGDLPAHAELAVPGAALPARGARRASSTCLRHVPYYRQWYRFWLFWKCAELLRPMAEVDPDWPDKSRSVGEGNDMLRQLLTEALDAPSTRSVPTCWRRRCRSTRRQPSGSSSTTARGRRCCTATTSR